MKPSLLLTITSLLSILFLKFHLTDDIVRGFEKGGLSNLVGGVLISVVWLYGTVVLAERRSGYIVMFLGSVFSLVVPPHPLRRIANLHHYLSRFKGRLPRVLILQPSPQGVPQNTPIAGYHQLPIGGAAGRR